MSIEGIGAFLGGATQGVGNGLNLYQQFDEIRSKGEKEARTKEMERYVSELSKTGEFKNDPIGATRKMRDKWFELGDADQAFKVGEYANQLQKTKGDKAAMEAYQLAKIDPAGAVAKLNEFAKTMETGDQFQFTRGPNGQLMLSGKAAGQPISRTFATAEEMEEDVMGYLLPYLAGPEGVMDAEKNRAAIAESEANIAESESKTRIAEAEAPLQRQMLENQAGLVVAQTAAQGAAAQANIANAGQSNAQAEYYRAQATKEADSKIVDMVDKLIPDPLDPSDVGATENKIFLGSMASLMKKEGGLGDNEAIALAYTILQSDPDTVQVDEARGTIMMPSGKEVKVGAGVIELLRTQQAQ